MTAGAHDAGGGFGRSAGANVARGLMVIVGAVIIGLLLMNRGLGDTQAEAEASGTEVDASDDGSSDGTEGVPAADTESTTTTVGEPESPTTLGAPRDPSEVAVLVLNGTAGDDGQPLKQVAGRGTDLLKTNNYITKDPKNSSVPGPSAVYFAEGFEAEARVVAEVMGAADVAAVVMAIDPAAPPIADLQGANIVVQIGNDGVIQV